MPDKPKRKLNPALAYRLRFVLFGVVIGLTAAGLVVVLLLPMMDNTPKATSTPTLEMSISGLELEDVAIGTLAITHDGKQLAVITRNSDSTSDIYIRQLDDEYGLLPGVQYVADDVATITHAEFTHDNRRLLISGGSTRPTQMIHLQNGTTWDFNAGHADISDAGNLMSVTHGPTTTFYQPDTGQWLAQINHQETQHAALNPDGTQLGILTHSDDGGATLLFYSTPLNESRGVAGAYDSVWEHGAARDFIFVPQGDRVIAVLEERMIWHNLALAGATYGPDPDLGALSMAAARDYWLAVAGEQGVMVWHYETRPGWTTLQWMQKAMLPSNTPISAITWTPDARYVFIGTSDGVVQLWDVIEGRVVWAMPV